MSRHTPPPPPLAARTPPGTTIMTVSGNAEAVGDIARDLRLVVVRVGRRGSGGGPAALNRSPVADDIRLTVAATP